MTPLCAAPGGAGVFLGLNAVFNPIWAKAAKALCPEEAQALCKQSTLSALGRPDPAPSGTDNTLLGFLRSITPYIPTL